MKSQDDFIGKLLQSIVFHRFTFPRINPGVTHRKLFQSSHWINNIAINAKFTQLFHFDNNEY